MLHDILKIAHNPFGGTDRYDPNLKLFLPGLPGVGSTIYDYSLNANHGTITGATWSSLRSGLPYLTFDGTDDWVSIGTINPLPSGTGTVIVWVKLNAGAATKNNYLVCKGKDSVTTSWGIGINPAAGGTTATFFLLYGIAAWVEVIGSPYIIGTWVHYTAVMRSDNTQELYVNGISVADGTKAVITPAAAGTFYIGRQGNDVVKYLTNGSIALNLVTTNEFTDSQVMQNYQKTKALFQ